MVKLDDYLTQMSGLIINQNKKYFYLFGGTVVEVTIVIKQFITETSF